MYHLKIKLLFLYYIIYIYISKDFIKTIQHTYRVTLRSFPVLILRLLSLFLWKIAVRQTAIEHLCNYWIKSICHIFQYNGVYSIQSRRFRVFIVPMKNFTSSTDVKHSTHLSAFLQYYLLSYCMLCCEYFRKLPKLFQLFFIVMLYNAIYCKTANTFFIAFVNIQNFLLPVGCFCINWYQLLFLSLFMFRFISIVIC